jgi:hypothetical protein
LSDLPSDPELDRATALPVPGTTIQLLLPEQRAAYAPGDLTQWLTASLEVMARLTQVDPAHCTPEEGQAQADLPDHVRYVAILSRMADTVPFATILAYDQRCRRSYPRYVPLANPWTTMARGPEIVPTFLRAMLAAPRPPQAAATPAPARPNPTTRRTSANLLPPHVTPGGQQVCFRYNFRACTSTQCPRAHACYVCFQQHPASDLHGDRDNWLRIVAGMAAPSLPAPAPGGRAPGNGAGPAPPGQ